MEFLSASQTSQASSDNGDHREAASSITLFIAVGSITISKGCDIFKSKHGF